MPLVPYTADISTTHRLDTDNAIEEIQHCINQLRMDEPLLATEYTVFVLITDNQNL